MTARKTMRPGAALGLTVGQTMGLAAFFLVISLAVQVLMLAPALYFLHVMEGVAETRSGSTLLALSVILLVVVATTAVLRLLRQALLHALVAVVERKLYLATIKVAIRLARDGRPEGASLTLLDFSTQQRFLAGNMLIDFLDLVGTPIPLAFMYAMHPLYGLVALVGCLTVAGFSLLTERLAHPAVRQSSEQSARAGSLLGRLLLRRDEVLGLGLIPGIVRHWFPLKEQALRQQQEAHTRSEIMHGLCHGLTLITVCAVFVLSAYLIVHQQATPASFAASHIVIYTLVAPFERVAQHWSAWTRAAAAFARFRRTLQDVDNPSPTPPGLSDLPAKGVHLVGLRLQVPGTDRVLVDDLHLQAPPGTLTLVTGRNGSGKSTLLRALVGLVEPAQGAVVFEGTAMHLAPRAEIGPRIGFLGQRPQLLDASILDNICRFSGDAEGAIRAARLCGAHEMIGRLNGGYTAPAGMQAKLSGGQQRQIALARACYGNPGLIVLDEPEVALDAKAIDALVEAVTELRRRGAVIFLVTHDEQRWAGIADLELRLGADGAWSTRPLAQRLLTTTE